MKWTVLSDNRTQNPSLLTEHGLSQYPETLFYTSHCTGDKVFATLKTIMGDRLHVFSCGMVFAANSKKQI